MALGRNQLESQSHLEPASPQELLLRMQRAQVVAC